MYELCPHFFMEHGSLEVLDKQVLPLENQRESYIRKLEKLLPISSPTFSHIPMQNVAQGQSTQTITIITMHGFEIFES